MNKQRLGICATIGLLLLLSGCSTQSNNAYGPMGNLLLAEPEPVNTRSQMAIARYNHILTQAPLKDEERAELLFQRGMLYDSVGLSSLARYDFIQALQLKPDMAEAHNSIGIHYIQQMDFIMAYESFDSTLDINPDYDFAILNRGIALYYGGRAELAISDLNRFYEKDKHDPYRVLWTFIVEQNIDRERAIANLAIHRKELDDENWATSIVDFYLGKVDETAVIADLVDDVKSQKQLNDRLCEAYFYLGKYHSDLGNKIKAANYFKLSLSTNVFEYVEYRFSRVELARLREKRKEDTSDSDDKSSELTQ
ncbi:lipoprotein NlpI [Brumicola pallidula]|uniref:Lipoprotein NlpI n=1 Tax=Brumicola pallidula DSM 14239 = ACAM 615 TaxID=1121922 RepID=K6ZH58_9ALTE|nr:lipoprotein NlpI [Glaciecola pallidula]GAC28248.1 lipoprotein NlpI [Glaciecola pallidula DSM 14239 = ACAM 615]